MTAREDRDALFVGRLGRAERQVLAHAAGQHGGILLDVADLATQLLAVEGADVDPAEPHDAGGRVVEPLDQREDGALARARRPDERDARAARDVEADAVEHLAIDRRDRVLSDRGRDRLLALGLVGRAPDIGIARRGS